MSKGVAALLDERQESIVMFNLEQHQLTVGEVHHNLPPSSLYEHAIRYEKREPIFGFDVPTECPGVPRDLLRPRGVWANPSAYDTTARKLADLFRENFKKYESGVSAEIKAAGPA